MVSIRMGWLWVEGTPMRLPLRALNLRQASPNLCQPHPFALGFTLSNPQGHSLATFWVMTANRNVLTRNLSGDGEGEGEGGRPSPRGSKKPVRINGSPATLPEPRVTLHRSNVPARFRSRTSAIFRRGWNRLCERTIPRDDGTRDGTDVGRWCFSPAIVRVAKRGRRLDTGETGGGVT